MQEILSTNKLCSLILASKSPSIGKENIQSGNSIAKSSNDQKYLFSDNISSSQLRNIQKQLLTEKSFSEILSPYRQLISYKIPELFAHRFNAKKISCDNSTIQYNFLVLMNSYLSVIIDYEKLDFEKSVSILQSLINFRLNYLSCANKKQRQIITSAFYHLYINCLSQFHSNDNNYLDRLVPIATEFFIQPNLLFVETQTGSHVYKIQNEQVFEILTETLKVIITPNERSFNPLAAQFISLIDSLVLQIGKNFPIQYLKSILQMCSGAISGLDSTALVFLSHLSNIIDNDSISSYLSLLPFSILSYIDHNNKNDDKPIIEIKNLRKAPIQCMNKTAYFYPENNFINSIFVDSLDLSNCITFPDLISFEEMLPKDILIKVSLVGKVAISNQKLITPFMQSIPKVFQAFINSIHALDAYAALLFLMKEIEENASFPVSLPIELISNHICFNPLITVFSFNKQNQKDEFHESWKIINSLRAVTIDLIAKQGINQMQTLLYNTMLYPEMFAEIVHRFLNVQGLLKIEKTDISILSQTLMSPMIYYQHFAPKENEESEDEKEEIESIKQARLSIIFFLNHLLSQPVLACQFFNDQFFIESLLSHLYEKPIRPSVIAHLTNYLSQKEAIHNTLIINQIILIAKNSINELNIIDSIDLLNNLLSVINKAILMNAAFTPMFKSIIPDICKGCVNLQKHEESDNLLYNIIQFLTLTATNNSISNVQLDALEKAISNIFDDGPNPALFGKIVQLIAGQSLSSLHPSFTIRNPKALKLLVAVFKSSPILPDAFTFIAKLLQSNVKNCEEAHRGEFDIYLMKFLEQYRNDETFQLTTFASALSLFMIISTSISSVSVVHSFISLLCPIDGRIIPYFQKLLVKSLSSMIPSLHKRPLSSLPLSSKTQFQFKGLKGEMFQNGFTFTFWIYLNSSDPNYIQQIISLEDSVGSRYAVNISASNIQILIEDNKKQYWAKSDGKIPLNKWCFISILMYDGLFNDQFRACVAINNENDRDMVYPRILLQPGILHGSIGGVAAKSVDIENPSLLGSVGIFQPLFADDVNHLYQLGPCVESLSSVQPLAFFVPHEKSGILSVKETSVKDTINVENNAVVITDSIRYFHHIPFCDVLISKCGINTILPLFAQLGMKFSDGQNFANLASIVVEILQNMLSLSENGQRDFYESDGCLILSHLLMKSDDSILNYSLYMQFFNLFNEVTNVQLKKQLFDVILMNVDLWIKCDAESHRRILRHWNKSLVPTFSEIAIQLRSFSWVLSTLRAYYWYSPIEVNIAMVVDKRCRNQSLNVKDCRNSMMSIAEFISNIKFDENEFKTFISHILTCTDHEQIVDLLSLLSRIIKEHKNLFEKVGQSVHLIPLLQYLLNINNVSIISSVFSVICDAHKFNVFNDFSLDVHIDVILHNIAPQVANKAMLKSLVELTSFVPESFPICSWVAMNIGDEGVRSMLKKLKPNESFTSSRFWSFYPVVALYKGDSKLRRYLSRFLIKCSMNGTMENLFATIEIVGRALEENSDLIKYILLFEYGKMIKRENLKNVDNYFALVVHYLFYRLDKTNNPALQELYENSPFVDSSRDIIDSFESFDSIPLSPIANNIDMNCNSHVQTKVSSPTRQRRNKKHNQSNMPITKPMSKQNETPSPSPKKSGNRRANNRDRRRVSRHSLHPNAILCADGDEENYNSPLLAQRALACLNPSSQLQPTSESFKARRTSLFTIGRKPVDNDSVVSSPDDKSSTIELMPSELDEKLKSVAQQEFKYSFGIRTNRKMEWLDIELAEQAFDLYLENKEEKLNESASLISSFLAIFKPEIMSKIDFNCSKIYSLLDHYQMMHQKPRILSSSILETEQIAFSIFQSIESSGSSLYKAAPLRLLKNFIKCQHLNSEISYDIFSLISSELVSLSTNKIADFCDSIGHFKNYNARLWSRFWSCMTIERAPWHKSLPPSYIKQQYFKRDDSSCFSLCPMKLKQNKNFCDHMDASFLREGGNCKTAKDLYEKYKEELRKQYEEKAPVELLEIVEENKENEMNNNINFDFENIGIEGSNSENRKREINQQRCIVELPCEIIHVNRKRKATFSLLSDMIVITKENNKKTFVIYLNQISMILYRTNLNHPTAIEIFLTNGSSYLINFFDVKSIPIIRSFSYLSQSRIRFTQNIDNFSLFFKNLPCTQDWINRKISNFEYLMRLNIFGGRTFNDPSQYPIMPWIIKDYESNVLDLNNPETFRDFSKPVGAITESRLQDLKNKMGSLSECGIKPYLYSSGAINPLATYLFMLRVEPFTTLHIELQSGRFDHAARLFNSIPVAFRLAMNNPNDYREIIPEFFYFTEFLQNKNNFDIGTFQGKKINDVELPKWASSPFEFVYLHRKALESEHVSLNLHKWIDLIWGEKQRGQKAEIADNTYMPYMYDDVWDNQNNLRDLAVRAQIESVLTHVGQIPHQLFQKPHPSRTPINQNSNNKLSNLIENPIKYSMNSQFLISLIVLDHSNQKIKLFSVDKKGSSIVTNCSIDSIKKNMIKMKSKGMKSPIKARSLNIPLSNHSMSEQSFILSPNKRLERACSDGVTSPIFQCIPFDDMMTSSIVSSKKNIPKFKQIFNDLNQKYLFTFNDELDSLFVVGSNNNETELHQIHFNETNNEETLLMNQSDDIVCIASNREWLATANRDAVVSLYKIEDIKNYQLNDSNKSFKHKFTFPSYTSSISCISISSEFHTMVFGTRDGSLLFCSLNNGTITKIINLEQRRRPTSLLITPSWGFVVVVESEICDGVLKFIMEIYSINGELIRSCEIENEIVAWSTFRNEKGFDFIVLANAKNECYLSEAFYLNNLDKPFFISPSKIAALSFLNDESVVTIATHNGEFILVPFDF